MPRTRFDETLHNIEAQVLAMGDQVVAALCAAVKALQDRDLERSQEIIAGDRAINARRFEIEHEILVTIATQQPMANDLRILAAMLEIITELERTGDYAKGISKINLLIGDAELMKPLVDIPVMADKATDMLQRALKAFSERDVETARAIPLEDDQVDNLYNQVSNELSLLIMAHPPLVEQANLLLWAAHNLERAADRVTNICERTVFTVTGEMRELDAN